MRIAILDDYQSVALSIVDWSGLPGDSEIVAFTDHVADPSQLIARLASFDIVCRMRERTPFPRVVLEGLPRLKLIAATGKRNADIDLVAARSLGITVCGTGSFPPPTIDVAWWLVLSLFRGLVYEHNSVRSGGWQKKLGRTVWGKTLGVVGLGSLGSGVARIALASGMQVLAWSPNLTPERAGAVGATAVSLHELLTRSDAVTLHMPLVEKTRNLLGAAELAVLKPGALLINTSRAQLVDESALIAGLRDGRIGGFGVDVFAEEPLPLDHPYRHLPNVVATPHIGYVTEEGYRVYLGETVENVLAFIEGKPVRVLN